MPRAATSDLFELLKLLRRIVVLGVAAYGLAREMPYTTLAVRLAALWAVLYISSGLVDIVFRRLSYQAAQSEEQKDEQADAPNPSGANLPVMSENRAS
ncbi:MAG TPA: hypothetical protein VGL38_10015 [bacterium]|jgi:hypothetical protein